MPAYYDCLYMVDQCTMNIPKTTPTMCSVTTQDKGGLTLASQARPAH